MSLLADALLLSAAIAAAFYCRVLATRLKALGDSGRGLGGAIATLDQQVDNIRAALNEAKTQKSPIEDRLTALVLRAEQASGRLEILLAGLHDTPKSGAGISAGRGFLNQSNQQVLRPENNGLAANRQTSKLFSRSAPHRGEGIS